jgi:hypothetical protein
MALAGLAVAPLVATAFELVDHVAPAGTATEASGWIFTAFTVGSGGGSALAGVVVSNANIDVAFLCACASGALAEVLRLAQRRTLRR